MNEPVELTLLAAADHAALPGHFPGTPLVPGVVVLDLLVEALGQRCGRPIRVTRLEAVKFTSALAPGLEARATAELNGTRVTFRIEQSDRPIASGSFTTAPPVGAA